LERNRKGAETGPSRSPIGPPPPRGRAENFPKGIVASLPRLKKPEEVALTVISPASDDASFITGEILDVNGGALMD